MVAGFGDYGRAFVTVLVWICTGNFINCQFQPVIDSTAWSSS